MEDKKCAYAPKQDVPQITHQIFRRSVTWFLCASIS